MRTKAIFLSIIALSLMGAGPIYQHKDTETQREFQNVYDDLKRTKVGTQKADNAAAGQIGEFVDAYIQPYVNAPASGIVGDLTSITLTPGDWDLSGMVVVAFNSATGFNSWYGAIGTVPGNSTTGIQLGFNGSYGIAPITGLTDSPVTIPPWRVVVSSSATYYLKMQATYSGGTPLFYGSIRARRVR